MLLSSMAPDSPLTWGAIMYRIVLIDGSQPELSMGIARCELGVAKEALADDAPEEIRGYVFEELRLAARKVDELIAEASAK